MLNERLSGEPRAKNKSRFVAGPEPSRNDKMGNGLESKQLLSNECFIDVAPTPILARLERLHDRMLGLMKVFRGVLILR